MEKINIISSFYIPNNKARKLEIIESLNNNLSCGYIECIHLFVDDDKCIDFLKDNIDTFEENIKICGIGKQPMYSDLFAYCDLLENKICMIVNSDIWLHSVTDLSIIDKVKEIDEKVIFAITRHEYNLKSPLIDNYQGSHDAFMFTAPIDDRLIKHVNHPQNIWGSENVVMFELNKLGYKIYNPCREIIIVHEHRSGARNDNRDRINRGDYNGDGEYMVMGNIW